MKKLLQDLLFIGLLAVLWWIAGAVMGMGIRAYFGVDWLMPCASLNLLLGMILLLVVMRDGQARERLFGENDQEMPLNLGLIILIGVPIILIFAGLLWFVIGSLFYQ